VPKALAPMTLDISCSTRGCNEEALAAGFWTVLVAEVVGGARGLSLDGEGAAA
jgi:hypothetical protein